jgi:hypothetical protein
VLSFLSFFVPINEKSVIPLPIFNLPPSPTCNIFNGLLVPIPTLPVLQYILDPDVVHCDDVFDIIFKLSELSILN